MENRMKKAYRTACMAWLLVLTAISAVADEIVVVPKDIAIAPGETRSLEFGTVPQRDTTTLLSITSRLHTASAGGSYFYLKVVLNGHVVEAARSRNAVRLQNKPIISAVARDVRAPWYDGHSWRSVFAPNFQAARLLGYYEGDPYLLTFDVSDLINPAGENRLAISHVGDRAAMEMKAGEGNLIVRRLTITTRPGPSPVMAADASASPVLNRGQPAAGPAKYHGELSKGGGFTITVGRRQWKFASAFSYPNAGMNRLHPSAQVKPDGQSQWSPTTHPRDNGGEVDAEGPDYRLHRTVNFTPRKVEVSDELTNCRRDTALGLLIRHETSLKDLAAPTVRLAGNADPAVTDYYSPMNPSVHVSVADHGIGILCEDDVFRNQARLFYADGHQTAGIRTEMLWLGPGESYTLQWAVYPIAGPDYFDFVNLVREDWGSNFTADGAWFVFRPEWILDQPINKLKTALARQGIKYAISDGGWVDRKHDIRRNAFGVGGLEEYWADYRRRLREAAARIREAAPAVKILVYYDTQRETAKDGLEAFRGCQLTDPKGNLLTTNWSNRFDNLTYSMVATADNAFGRATLAAADEFIDATGSDGIYWDELEAVGYGIPLIAYNQFDGHSCLLDPKRYTIERQVGITTLLAERHRLAVIERVQNRGGPMLGNSPPCTRAILATGIPRMVETQHNDYWCYEGNFGTPLGYLDQKADFASVVRVLRMACLPVDVHLETNHLIQQYLFPFTPVELHYGYMLGKERIIATHDGNYGWIGDRCLVQMRHFNREGQLAEDDAVTTIGGEAKTAVKLDKEEAVVLVRLPITFDPQTKTSNSEKEPIEVRRVQYAADRISLSLVAPQGGTLTVRDGDFRLTNESQFTVRLGRTSESRKVIENALRVSVPSGFLGDVSIERQ
jgi:hypothetical protein